MKKVILLAMVLMLSLALIGCSGEKVEKEEVVKVEQEVIRDIDVVLNSTDKTKEDKWQELEEGKELVLIDVTITNNTDKEYEFMPDYFSLRVDGDRLNVTDVSPVEGKSLHTVMIEPGGSITGLVNFEVEEGKDYKIIYNDFDNEIEIN